MKEVTKVKKVFDNFVELPKKVFSPKKAIVCNGGGYNRYNKITVYKLGKGKWTADIGSINHTFDGCVGGFNVYALYVLEGLYKLRLITRKEADEFENWWAGQEKKNKIKNDLRKLEELTQKYKHTKN